MLEDDDTPGAVAGAIELAQAGYFVAPVTIRRNPVTGKKMPTYHGQWGRISTTDVERIRAWGREYGPDLSFCIDTEKSGVVGIDLDVRDERTVTKPDGTTETVPAVDGVLEFAMTGLPVGPMIVTSPSGGAHHLWRQPAGEQVTNRKPPWQGVDIRGVGGHLYAPGSRVVGEVVGWEVQGPLVPVAELDRLHPDILAKLPRDAAGPRTRRQREQGDRAYGATHDREWVIRQCAMQLDRVRAHDGRPETGFRHVLLGASVMYGRAVAAGLVDRRRAEDVLADACYAKWGAVDDDDAKWIADGLDDGESDPWTVVEPRPEPSIIDRAALGLPVAAGQGGVQESRSTQSDGQWDGASAPVVDAGAALAKAVANEIERQDVRELATRARAERDRRPLKRLSAREFLAAPQPTYLVPGLLYVDSLAVVFGPPGAAKTFFTLDLALCLATGRAWRGEVLVPRTRVHYLMAEGQAVNVGRTLAWLEHHGVDGDALDGWFDAFPEPISLTVEGVGEYLREVEADRPGLIILDTKHAMMEGDESKSADIKVMRDALTLLRSRTGACVVLVDHTGLNDLDRARGSNSQKAMVATEVKLSANGSVRTAEITRDTAGEVGKSWSFTLEQVPDAPHAPGTAVPVVPVPANRRAVEIALRDSHWDVPRTDLPAMVAELGGKMGDAAQDIFRALVTANDHDGMTIPTIAGLVKESPRAPHSRTYVYEAANRLIELGVLDKAVGGGKSYVLGLTYRGWDGSKVAAT